MLASGRLRLIFAAALILLAVVSFVVWMVVAPPQFASANSVRPGNKLAATIQLGELPAVEPLQFQPISRDDALKINESIPFSKDPNPAAFPFRFGGASSDLSRAADCLAAAAYYEAGSDAVGQEAVVQVVLNRLRHPAFPKTVCGVVFQGSDRPTGCQFTFTCDGALARQPSPAAWLAARRVAINALAGAVYAPVGYATHYHTDWVAPYWSGSLDKVAAVKTHLFFRWKGWWGTPRAFAGTSQGIEPVIQKIMLISEAHRNAGPLTPEAQLAQAQADAQTQAELAGAAAGDIPAFSGASSLLPAARVLLQNDEGIVILLDRGAAPGTFAQLAASLCGTRDLCKVRGWTDRATAPASYPISQAAMSAMSFSYIRNRSQKFERPQWNCDQFQRTNSHECLKIPFKQAAVKSAPPPPAAAVSVTLAEHIK